MTGNTNGSNAGRNKPHVLIAGAGMGGLAAGLALLQKGFDVDIFELGDELRELGAGLWVSANGAVVLRSLGLEEQIHEINLPAADRVVRLWNTGESWSVYNRGKDASDADHSLIMVLRSELQRILYEAIVALKPDAIRFGAKVTGFEDHGQRVELHIADGSTATGDILVGADGAHSAIRRAMFGPAEGRFTGALAWRGVTPMSRLTERHREPIAATWVGPTAHVTTYPIRRGDEEMVSFSGQVDSQEWHAESWSDKGSLEDALRDFAGWHEDITDLFRGADMLFRWGLFVRPTLATWFKGHATLLGDACHSMVPYLGQGLNVAFEDSYILARCLDEVTGAPAEALATYDRLRRERANLVVQRSMDMLPVFHHSALATTESAIPYIEKNWSPEMMRKRYDWLVSYDVNEVRI